ncbi:MAG: alpha-ketoglutarate-dependent dioxygenase AlkB, partial [Nocardioides sp.]
MDFQTSLFAAPPQRLRSFEGLERRTLSDGAWVDVLRSWVPDADDIFTTMVSAVPWRAERRQMYDRVVDVPRLVYTYMIGEELPHPVLTEARDALTEHYLPELGEPFRTAGCCY